MYSDGDVKVSVGGVSWTFNPECLTLVTTRPVDGGNGIDVTNSAMRYQPIGVELVKQLFDTMQVRYSYVIIRSC